MGAKKPLVFGAMERAKSGEEGGGGEEEKDSVSSLHTPWRREGWSLVTPWVSVRTGGAGGQATCPRSGLNSVPTWQLTTVSHYSSRGCFLTSLGTAYIWHIDLHTGKTSTCKIKINLKKLKMITMQLAPGEHQVCSRPLAEDSIGGVFDYRDFTIEVVILYMSRD